MYNAELVLIVLKIIRGYGGAAVGVTQDIADFFALDGGKYGKGIIINSKLKFVLKLEEDEAEALRKVLKLSNGEMAKVTTFARKPAYILCKRELPEIIGLIYVNRHFFVFAL